MSTSLSWLEQIAAQFRDLKYEEGTPVFATVLIGLVANLDERELPCVSLAVASAVQIDATVFVAKSDGYQGLFPTSENLDTEILIWNITKITLEKMGVGRSTGYLSNGKTVYRTLHYTFWR